MKRKKKQSKKLIAENKSPKPMRNYKDKVFRMIFKDKEKLLELYNAVNGTAYQNPEEMTITTKEELHSIGQVQIPEPKFLVFYNGTEEMPERWEQKLSDAYFGETEDPALELRTTVLNINLGKNQILADKCRPLKEYMIFVGKIREYNKGNTFTQAVELAVTECIKEGVMADFLIKNRAEVVRMSIYEYNAEKVQQADREYGRQLGLKEGMAMAVYRKMERGKNVSTIATELEVDIAVVEKIAETAAKFVGKYSWLDVRDKILKAL